MVISVCLDKKRHREQYTVWRYNPYHYYIAVLLERFVFLLHRRDAHGDVMAESRGSKEDMRLKGSFRGLWEKGTDYAAPDQFQEVLTSLELKVRPKSANVAGLQLADLVAHPSRAEILHENGFQNPPASFAMQVIEILQSKYDRKDGRVFGKKLL